MTKIVATSPF